MKKKHSEKWDLSSKKWLYWTGTIGHVFSSPIIWLVSLTIYLIYDRNKPKTENYQIEKTSHKFIIVIGNIAAVIWILFLASLFFSDVPNSENKVNLQDSCPSDQPYLCGNTCFSCDQKDTKLCCLSETDNWCCPLNSDCDYSNKGCVDKYVAPKVYCGDKYCNGNEVCSSCPEDCGVCKDDILKKMKNTIVWVKYDVIGKNQDGSLFESGGTGSGVIVGNKDDELIVYTNRHVVDCEYNDMHCFQRISEKVQIRTQDGKMYDVNTVSFSKSDVDLAILTVKTSQSKNYEYAYYTDEFKIGDIVTAIGYPSYAQNVVEFSVSNGKINNIKEVLSQSTGFGFKVIESDAYTYFGSSGGGLFDKYGNLVGITTWGANKETVAIIFSSIQQDKFVYCSEDAYFAEGNCYEKCEREQVMDYKNRNCYDVCDEFYCDSQIPPTSDSRCKDSGYIAGSDGYCHQPCSSSTSYCQQGSICLRNRCYSPCSIGYLWEDASCRLYE
jgi:hypothetical protein